MHRAAQPVGRHRDSDAPVPCPLAGSAGVLVERGGAGRWVARAQRPGRWGAGGPARDPRWG